MFLLSVFPSGMEDCAVFFLFIVFQHIWSKEKDA